MKTNDDILTALESLRSSTRDEFAVHAHIESELKRCGITFAKEYRLSARDRIDFFCAGVGIEVKVDGTAPSVERQLKRYADSDEVASLVLVTTRRRHCAVSRDLNGKPVSVIYVGGFV